LTDDSEEVTLGNCPEDEGSKLLRNVGQYLPDYMVKCSRRQLPSKYEKPQKRKIFHELHEIN
jgi:hypothetical protein